MPGASQGTRCPGHEPKQNAESSANKPTNWANTAKAGLCRSPRGTRTPLRRRPRITFSDAQLIRERVDASAGQLALRGARRHTLHAAQKLLCGWSRITDDHVALSQVAALIAAAGGRRYDLKTIGRALASLAADELLVYRPAQGRGTRAFLAIHDRFLTGITVLERDRNGRVITDYSAPQRVDSVTFSARLPYKNQTHYPPTPQHANDVPATRPTEVKVSTTELRMVLRALPAPMTTLPKNLRWTLGREIRQRLHAGWRPDQIIEVLSAPVPVDVQRPWRLALWRLRHNVVGAGPRLRPLQQAFDAATTATEKAAAAASTARWYDDVAAVTGPDQRAQLLAAHEAKFGRRPNDPVAAIAAAGRRAARLFPQLPLAAALERWVRDVLGARAGSSEAEPGLPEPAGGIGNYGEVEPARRGAGRDLFIDLAIGDCDCVVCGSRQATARPELPLKSTVCDQCWPLIAADLSAADSHDAPNVAAA